MKTEKEIRQLLINIEKDIIKLKLEGCDAGNNWIFESNKYLYDYYGIWADALRTVLEMPNTCMIDGQKGNEWKSKL